VDPQHYRRHDVELKEGRTTAWFMVPGRSRPPEPQEPPEEHEPLEAQAQAQERDPADGPSGEKSPRSQASKGTEASEGTGGRFVQNSHQHGGGDVFAAERIETINNRPSRR
jgi:hypothetical protein